MNIFVVEDSQSVRRLLVRRLEALVGARVVGEAAGEAQAIALIEWLKPDTVLLDLSLVDGGSGLRVLAELRRHGFTGRVLVLTHEAHEAYRRAATEAGADGFYDKASGLETLLDDLTDLIARQTLPQLAALGRPTMLIGDGLTGMFGEAALLERLDQAARLAQRDGGELAVYVMRLEGLTELAERSGVAAVNTVLHEVAARLREVCAPEDVLARHAADQFSLVLTRVESTAAAAAFAVRLQALVDGALAQMDDPSALRAQVGMALFPCDAIAPRSLLTLAEAHAYGALPPQQASRFSL